MEKQIQKLRDLVKDLETDKNELLKSGENPDLIAEKIRSIRNVQRAIEAEVHDLRNDYPIED